MLIPCLPIALLKILDKKPDEASARQNHRLIAVPAAAPGLTLSDLLRAELEGFFRVVGQQIKEVTILGWGDEREARAEVLRTMTAYAKNASRTPELAHPLQQGAHG